LAQSTVGGRVATSTTNQIENGALSALLPLGNFSNCSLKNPLTTAQSPYLPN
jgi:hypothetical protein